MTASPRPKVTRADSEEAVLARHVFRDAYGACTRCGSARSAITYSRLPCISDARAAGNAAIGRIVARGSGA